MYSNFISISWRILFDCLYLWLCLPTDKIRKLCLKKFISYFIILTEFVHWHFHTCAKYILITPTSYLSRITLLYYPWSFLRLPFLSPSLFDFYDPLSLTRATDVTMSVEMFTGVWWGSPMVSQLQTVISLVSIGCQQLTKKGCALWSCLWSICDWHWVICLWSICDWHYVHFR